MHEPVSVLWSRRDVRLVAALHAVVYTAVGLLALSWSVSAAAAMA
jgi:hypothetical protein